MSYEQQQNRPSPPPTYAEATPGGMENELYIDGTLYVDGVPVSRSEQQGLSGRRGPRHVNPCEKAIRLVRSKFQLICFFEKRRIIYKFIELWATQQTERIDRQQHKEKYVQTTIRELIVYLIFLTILSISKIRFLFYCFSIFFFFSRFWYGKQ